MMCSGKGFRKKPRYTMSGPYHHKLGKIYRFWGTGPWPFYHGWKLCIEKDHRAEAVAAFIEWIPDKDKDKLRFYGDQDNTTE